MHRVSDAVGAEVTGPYEDAVQNFEGPPQHLKSRRGAAMSASGRVAGERPALLEKYYRAIALPMILVLWLYGGMTQLQVWLFGEVHLYSIHFKITLLAATALVWVITNSVETMTLVSGTRPLRTAYLWWLGYITFASLLISVRFTYPIDYVLFSFNVLFYFPLFIGFLIVRTKRSGRYYLQERHSQSYLRQLLAVLTTIALPILALGIAQYMLDDPILPTTNDRQEYLRVIHTAFIGGGTRAFGIFTSGWAFGDFMTFMALLWFASALSRYSGAWQRPVLMALAAAACFGVFATLTRVVFAQCALAFLGLYLLGRRSIGERRYIAVSLAAAAASVLTILVVSEQWGSEFSYLTNTASLNSRFFHWNNIVDRLDQGNAIANWVFGKGLIANERYALAQGFNTDSMYLALILHSGVVGMAASLFLFYQVFRFTVSKARESDNPFWNALAAMYFAVPFSGVWTVQINTPALLFVVVWLISPPLTPTKPAVMRASPRHGGGAALSGSDAGSV